MKHALYKLIFECRTPTKRADCTRLLSTHNVTGEIIAQIIRFEAITLQLGRVFSRFYVRRLVSLHSITFKLFIIFNPPIRQYFADYYCSSTFNQQGC